MNSVLGRISRVTGKCLLFATLLLSGGGAASGQGAFDLQPSSVTAGSAGFTLSIFQVGGTFDMNETFTWQGPTNPPPAQPIALVAQFPSDPTTVNLTIPGSLVAIPGPVTIIYLDSDGASHPLNFTINPYCRVADLCPGCIIFQDSQFNDSDWMDSIVYNDNGHGTATSQVAEADYSFPRSVVHTRKEVDRFAGSGDLIAVHLKRGANVSVPKGKHVSNISYSYDLIDLTPPPRGLFALDFFPLFAGPDTNHAQSYWLGFVDDPIPNWKSFADTDYVSEFHTPLAEAGFELDPEPTPLTTGGVTLNLGYATRSRELGLVSGPVSSITAIANWCVAVQLESDVPVPNPRPPTFGNSGSTGSLDGLVADPVSTGTGEFFDRTTDLSLGGPLPLSFVRYYASYLKSNGVSGALGNNWMHNFDAKVTASGPSAIVQLFGGRTMGFVQFAGTWQLAQPESFAYQLVSTSDGGYRFLHPRERLIYTFAPSGALLKIEDRNGNALTVTQSASGTGPDQVTDGLGRTVSFTYTNGKLTQVQDQTGRSVSFSFSGDDLTAATDTLGKTTTYTYASAGSQTGLLTSRSLPSPLTQTLDSFGRVTQQSDAAGNSTALSFDQLSPSSTTIANALSSTFQHLYQGGIITGFIDPSGQGMVFRYDGNYRRTSVTDRFGDQMVSTYDPASGYTTSYTDASGKTTKYTFTAQPQGPQDAQLIFYDLTRIDYPDGTSLNLTYDTAGNVLTSTDQAGKTWTYTYNSRGQVVTVTNPAGGITTLSYNADATLASIKDAGGVTSFAYDTKKRLQTITYPDSATRTFAYNDRDDVIQDTRENGSTRRVTYNEMNRLASVTDTQGNTASVGWTAAQHPSSFTAASGKTAGVSFNPTGVLKQITYPTGEAAKFNFDQNGRLNGVTDCSGKGVGVTYDKEGVISSLTNGLAHSWSITSDKQARTTAIADPLSAQFQYGYDSAGRLISFTDPLLATTSYSRDPVGHLTGISGPGGLTASFTRNELGQVLTITDPNASKWNRSYDPQGRLLSLTDPLGQETSYSYDTRNRVAKIAWPASSVSFSYDASGNIIRALYSGGPDLKLAYDGEGRLLSGDGISLTYNALGSVITSNGLAISRDDSNRITGITYADGKTVGYSYDCRGLLTQIKDWAGGSTQLAYDDARHLVSITRPNGVVTARTYDAAGRLTGISEKKSDVLSSIALTRGVAGQITSAARSVPLPPSAPATTASFTYDSASQLSGSTYDSQGRIVSDGLRKYQWDGASRLASYSGADGSASFTYDVRGTRISKTSSGKTQSYAVNYALGVPSLAVVRDAAGDLRYFVALPDGTLLYSIEAKDSSRHFYHFDETGSTSFLTNDAGAITDEYAYLPYGEQAGRSGSFDNPFTFLGAYGVMQEGATGLYSMGARYYDSTTARFLTRDTTPTYEAKAIDPYQYGRGNPLANADPAGAGSRGTIAPQDDDFSRLGFSLAQALTRDPRIGQHWAAHPVMIGLLHFLGGSDRPGVLQYITNVAGLYCQFRPCSRLCAALGALGDGEPAEAGEVRGPVLGERIGEWGTEVPDMSALAWSDEAVLRRVAAKGLVGAASTRCQSLPNNSRAIGAFGGGREAETRFAPAPDPKTSPVKPPQ